MTAPRSTDDGLRQAVADRRALEWLTAEGIGVVHAGLFDTAGTLRSKRLSAAAAARALTDGWSFIDAIQWWAPDDRTWGGGGSAQGEVTLDPSTLRPYPFEPGAALILGDFTGPLAELAPRSILSRMVERTRGAGFDAEVGWEFECIVLEGADPATGPTPTAAMAANRCWSALTPAVEAETLAGLDAALGAGAIPLDHLCAELGPGCLELATEHRPARLAADDAALAKLYTKAFFARRTLTATFMAQLGEEFPGLGGHPTLSLRAVADGRPVLADAPGTLSKVAGSAVAGVVALLPELAVMLAPTTNSYRRFAPGNWAPRRATWGIGNYSCGLRVVTGDAQATRLELRVPGADVDPHLGLAMFLGAATWGIEAALAPPDPVVAPDDGRVARGAPLPRTLAEAVDLFVAGPTPRELFGSRFVEHYAASRLAEDEACRRFVPDGERRRHLHHA